MKKFQFILCLVILSLPVLAQEVKKAKVEDIDAYIRNSDHRLVISFWATWCAPCLHEIPWLEAAIEKNKDTQVELVLISLDFPELYPKRLTNFIKQRGFKATFFYLDETDADHFCPVIDPKWSGGIPATLFINPKTGYRKFYDRQVTDLQASKEVGVLVKE